MKKTAYNIPALRIINLTESDMLLLTMSDNTHADPGVTVEVKEDVISAPSSYSVWNDDWSN